MKMMKFAESYQKLNPQQKLAVDTVEGPVMVVAGPGTGKTQILTLRIANILRQTHIKPENILALTFTESGVASMRRRLVEIIGSPAYSVVINTFHGFCEGIIKDNPGSFPRVIGSQSITEVDQARILENIITRLPLKELKPFGDTFYYLRAALSAVNELKREAVDSEKFTRTAAEELEAFDGIEDLYYEKGAHKGKMKGDYQKLQKKILKNLELAEIYAEYQKELESAKLYDYSDMIMEVLGVLAKSSDLLLILQEQYQYFLVDEHQDTNNAQNKILELLCNFHPNPNIFVVGDEKQAIFRFQGASLENFSYFKKLYPGATLVALEHNYRSTQAILDSAHSLLAGEKALKANVKHDNEKIGLYAFSRPEVEYLFLGKDINAKLSRGVPPDEIAVLYRDNKDAFPVARMLEKAGVPFVIQSDQDILSDPDIRKLIALLRAVNEFGSPDVFLEVLHIDFLGIDPLDIYKLIEYSNSRRIPALDVAKGVLRIEGLKLEFPERIHDFYKKLSGWAIAAKNNELAPVFEEVVRESGFLAHIIKSPEVAEKLDKLNGLFDEIKKMVEAHRDARLADFFEYLGILKEHDVLVKKSHSASLAKKVRLMTAHRSKGMEFEHVYIIDAYDGHWGNKRRSNLLSLPSQVFSLTDKISEPNPNDDERRLFYVALTRAKKSVTITYAKQSGSGREQLPCQFTQEIKPELIENKDGGVYEKDFEDHKELVFAAPQKSGVNIKDKEFIREIFAHHGFSVTALNNYLACPWKFFYTNLLRIPKAKSKHQMYGTAVHNSLKDFFDNCSEGVPPKDFLLDKFSYYLDREPLNKHDFKEAFAKGVKSLGGYYDLYNSSWRTRVLTEFDIAGVMLDDIRLTGKIDKIEFLGDGSEVNVVDYKTGKPKTRGEIEGSTANSNGDIKRQLTFYNLLLNKHADGKYKMTSGDIDFVEPDDKNKYKKESFSILKEEINELEGLIKKTAHEILELEFWEKRCDDKDCEYCALRDMMA